MLSLSSFLQGLDQITAPALFLITGPSGTGKTTGCLGLAQEAMSLGWQVSGLCSPPVFDMDKKIAIDLLDLNSTERKQLAILNSGNADDLATQHWKFNVETLQWGNAILQELGPCDLFILDELGPLELERGLGFSNAFSIIQAGRFRLACVVVRPSLLPLAQERWPWARIFALPKAAA